MQGKHPLVQCQGDQIDPLRIDLQRGVKLMYAAISLHHEVLLQTDRCAERRRRQL
jgi:hypothetical protein